MRCTLHLSVSSDGAIAEENIYVYFYKSFVLVDISRCFVACQQVIIPAILPCLYLTKLSLRLSFMSGHNFFLILIKCTIGPMYKIYIFHDTFIFSCVYLYLCV